MDIADSSIPLCETRKIWFDQNALHLCTQDYNAVAKPDRETILTIPIHKEMKTRIEEMKP